MPYYRNCCTHFIMFYKLHVFSYICLNTGTMGQNNKYKQPENGHLPTVLHVRWFIHSHRQFNFQVTVLAVFGDYHFMQIR